MNDGKRCPACGKDIGPWPIVKMPWPNVGLACPHCRAGLAYQPPGYWIFWLLVPYVPLLLAAEWIAFERLGPVPPAYALAIVAAFALWAPFEAFIVWRFRTHGRLELKAARKQP